MSALAIVLLLLGNAFFVGAEFALIASRRTAVEPLAETSRLARYALSAMGQIPLMIAGAQLGVTVCSLGLGAVAEPAFAHALEAPFDWFGLPSGAIHPVAFLLALAVVVFLHTVLGEMVPKNMTLAGPERAVLWLGPPMLAFCTAFKPLLNAMKWAARGVLAIWRIPATEAVKTVYTADELAGLVAESRTEGLLDAEEHARITGALALHEQRGVDAMLPWDQVVTVAEDITPASLELLAARSRRSRFPVVARASRRVLGFIHVKDVIGLSGAARLAPVPREMVRPIAAVAPDRTLADLLLAMRRERWHIVLVSEGGLPRGIVTLDDVLHAVVGEPSRRALAGRALARPSA